MEWLNRDKSTVVCRYVVQIAALNEHSEGSWLGGLFRKKSTVAQSGAPVAGNPYQVRGTLS